MSHRKFGGVGITKPLTINVSIMWFAGLMGCNFFRNLAVSNFGQDCEILSSYAIHVPAMPRSKLGGKTKKTRRFNPMPVSFLVLWRSMVCVCVLSVSMLTHTESVIRVFPRFLGEMFCRTAETLTAAEYFSRPFSEPRKHLLTDSVDTLTIQGDELLNRARIWHPISRFDLTLISWCWCRSVQIFSIILHFERFERLGNRARPPPSHVASEETSFVLVILMPRKKNFFYDVVRFLCFYRFRSIFRKIKLNSLNLPVCFWRLKPIPLGGLPYMMSAKFSDFLPPPWSLSQISWFCSFSLVFGDPIPPTHCGRHILKPPKVNYVLTGLPNLSNAVCPRTTTIIFFRGGI